MRFFTSAVLALSALSGLVFAVPQTSPPAPTPTGGSGSGSLQNPISSPTSGTTCEAGKSCPIKWTPTSNSKNVKLILKSGDSDNLNTVEVIVDNTPNSGSYDWVPSKDLKGGSSYSIQITDDSGNVNYSPKFTIKSSGSGLSSTTTSGTVTKTSTTTGATTTTTGSSTGSSKSGSTSGTATATSTGSSYPTTTTTSHASKTTPTSTSTGSAQNSNSANGLYSQSPLALLLCVGAAMAYLS